MAAYGRRNDDPHAAICRLPIQMQLEMKRVGADRHRHMGHIGDRKTDHRVDDPLHFEHSYMSQAER